LVSISPTATSSLRFAFLVLAALIVGCAGQAPREVTTDTDWDSHSAALADMKNWSFSGRVAVKTGQSADTARLQWRQRADDLELTLSGPAGFREATLVRADRHLTLLRNGEPQPIDSQDDLLQREFGWSLPLDYLPWWLRGLPAPQLPAGRREISAGRLTLLEQAGWTVEYPDYQWVQGWQLPRTIRFQRDEVQGKILLKDWVLDL
jgi:outer membrane lipoprotein LolB